MKPYKIVLFIVALWIALLVASETFGYTRTEANNVVFDYENRPDIVQLFKTAGYAEGLVRQYQYQCNYSFLPGHSNPSMFLMMLQVAVSVDAEKEGIPPESYAAFYIIDNFSTGMNDAVDLECHSEVTEYLKGFYQGVQQDVVNFINTEREEKL